MNQPRSQFEPARAYSYMHESSLLTYLHIPSVFHNKRPCNGYHELYSGRNIDFTLKNHCPARPLFYFFGVTVRFDWIKIDVWLKLGVLIIIRVDPNCHKVRLMWSTAFDLGLSVLNLKLKHYKHYMQKLENPWRSVFEIAQTHKLGTCSVTSVAKRCC